MDDGQVQADGLQADGDGVAIGAATTTFDPASVYGAIDAAFEPVLDHLSAPGTASLADVAAALRVVRQGFALAIYGAPVSAAPVDYEAPPEPVPYDAAPAVTPIDDTAPTDQFTPAAG